MSDERVLHGDDWATRRSEFNALDRNTPIDRDEFFAERERVLYTLKHESRHPTNLQKIFEIAVAHPDDPLVHTAVFSALSEMACDEAMTPNEMVQNEMGGHGALTYVLEGMRTFPGTSNLVAAGCWALCNICWRHEANLTQATKLGAIQTIVQVLEGHRERAQVQQRGCGAIFSLTWTDEAAQNQASEAGAVVAVTEAMTAHTSVAGVQEYGAMALMALTAAHEGNQAEVAKSGALKQVMKTMRAHRGDRSVLDACMRQLQP